jgi:hypothetical protein
MVIGTIYAIIMGKRNKFAAIIGIALTIGVVLLLSFQTNKYLERLHKEEIQLVISEKGGHVLKIETEVLNHNIKYNITYKKDGKVLHAIYLGTKNINNIHSKDKYGKGEVWTFIE